MGKATVRVPVCVCEDEVVGCACHPNHTATTHSHTQHERAATKPHATHTMCVCEAEEWAVDDHSGLVVCVMVMVGGEEGRGGGWWWEKHKKGGEWWMKGGMV